MGVIGHFEPVVVINNRFSVLEVTQIFSALLQQYYGRKKTAVFIHISMFYAHYIPAPKYLRKLALRQSFTYECSKMDF